MFQLGSIYYVVLSIIIIGVFLGRNISLLAIVVTEEDRSVEGQIINHRWLINRNYQL